MYAVLETLNKHLNLNLAQINKCVKKLPRQEYELTKKVRKSTQKLVDRYFNGEQDTVILESGRKDDQ